MNFFRVENGVILDGPVPLPRLWADANGVQHPLNEMWSKGHTEDVIAFGWLPEYREHAVVDEDTDVVDGQTYTVRTEDVLVTDNVRSMTQEEIDTRLEQKRSYMVVSMRQARLALLQAGLLPQIDAAIASLTEPEKSGVSIEWEYAQEVKRHHAWVIALGQHLGLSDQQLDDLFTLAESL